MKLRICEELSMNNNLQTKIFDESDIKREGIQILKAVHNFCVTHKLKYSLFFGTLLGAIRHNGYIPWDDDIDIAMPRDDYEVFVREFNNENYAVASCFLDRSYYLPFAKAYSKNTIKKESCFVRKKYEIGFNIDVFPLDYCDSRETFLKVKKKEKWLIFKHRCSIYKPHSSKIKNLLINIVLLPFRYKYNMYSRKIDRFVLKNVKCVTKKFIVGTEVTGENNELLFDGDIFDNLVEHKFENNSFLVSSKYHEILTKTYGDYMTPPPENEQKPHHSFIAYYK